MICEAVMNKRSVGSIYEQLAAEQLINMGYSVLACNYRNRFGEIDIIAKDGDTICFCEVKYRRDNGCGRTGITEPLIYKRLTRLFRENRQGTENYKKQ